MWASIGAVAALGLVLWAVIALAKNSGRNAARLEALKQEAERTAKEQERANAIHDSVDNLLIDDVRERLQNVARK
ncbi:hypothetical protein [Candidatus Avelusimicrobium aviculae]|uniref:hypothetical protein n=1 Tax=Candidatus Avelusimicrobium aviculae TaxID=3416206 RepID=UPI003D108C2A